jgi:hypothetical protein
MLAQIQNIMDTTGSNSTDAFADVLSELSDDDYFKLAAVKKAAGPKATFKSVLKGQADLQELDIPGITSEVPVGASAPASPVVPVIPVSTPVAPLDLLDISNVTSYDAKAIYTAFKNVKPVTPNWGGSAIFKNLQALKESSGGTLNYNDGQLLKILDTAFPNKPGCISRSACLPG